MKKNNKKPSAQLDRIIDAAIRLPLISQNEEPECTTPEQWKAEAIKYKGIAEYYMKAYDEAVNRLNFQLDITARRIIQEEWNDNNIPIDLVNMEAFRELMN